MKNLDALRARWQRLLDGAGTSRERRLVFDALVELHSDGRRQHHTLEHVSACLDEFDRVPRNAFVDPLAVELAIWFHDAIYEPQRRDSEVRSAEFADAALTRLKTSQSLRRPVRELILVTDHKIAPRRLDAMLLVDIDLAVFGQDARSYDAYENAIRAEYAFVEDELYPFARANVLKRLLHRPNVYLTSPFQSQYEIAARENLNRTIRRLSGR